MRLGIRAETTAAKNCVLTASPRMRWIAILGRRKALNSRATEVQAAANMCNAVPVTNSDIPTKFIYGLDDWPAIIFFLAYTDMRSGVVKAFSYVLELYLEHCQPLNEPDILLSPWYLSQQAAPVRRGLALSRGATWLQGQWKFEGESGALCRPPGRREWTCSQSAPTHYSLRHRDDQHG